MYFLAAAATTKSPADRLRDISPEFWVKIGIGIAILIVAVIVLRKVAKMNKVILSIIVLVVLSMIGFNWIYERNEPAWATPVVDWLANYFPSKGAARPDPASKVK
jgi:hypothetical protein